MDRNGGFVVRVHSILFGWYLFAGLFTFAVYGRDKWAAKTSRWRTAEPTLHILSLLGGWPGAFVAQRLFRHKSRKKPFQSVFLITIVANVAATGGLFWLCYGSSNFPNWL